MAQLVQNSAAQDIRIRALRADIDFRLLKIGDPHDRFVIVSLQLLAVTVNRINAPRNVSDSDLYHDHSSLRAGAIIQERRHERY